MFTFWSVFSIHGMSKATPGTTKMNALWCIFAGQATACGFNHCDTRRRIFLWSVCGEFCTIFSDFCIHGVNKATPGTTKMNVFPCIFAGRATACVFDHYNTGVNIFSLSFCGDFRCILASFCVILRIRPEAWSRSMNGPRSTSKRVIFITFSSVFDTGKIEFSITFRGFPEK